MKWAFTGRHDWLRRRGDLIFVGAALATQSDDPRIHRLLARIRAELEEWQAIETDGEDLRAMATAARARVSIADAALDHRLHRFATDLLETCDAASDTYQKFFPEPHEEIIALGLACEIPMATLVLGRLASKDHAAQTLRDAHADALRAALQLGHVALSDRAEAYAALGRHQARTEAWLTSCAAILRTTRDALAKLAEDRRLSPRWVDAFFPTE